MTELLKSHAALTDLPFSLLDLSSCDEISKWMDTIQSVSSDVLITWDYIEYTGIIRITVTIKDEKPHMWLIDPKTYSSIYFQEPGVRGEVGVIRREREEFPLWVTSLTFEQAVAILYSKTFFHWVDYLKLDAKEKIRVYFIELDPLYSFKIADCYIRYKDRVCKDMILHLMIRYFLDENGVEYVVYDGEFPTVTVDDVNIIDKYFNYLGIFEHNGTNYILHTRREGTITNKQLNFESKADELNNNFNFDDLCLASNLGNSDDSLVLAVYAKYILS